MLKAGFYEKEITPPLGFHIPGYFEDRRGRGVHDRLYAKAVALELDGKVVIAISMDCLQTTDAICEKVFSRIEEITGVKGENVMISATHTHTGMPVPKIINGPDATNEYEAYFEILSCLVADAGILAYQRLTPCKIKYASSIEKGLTFCRNYYMKDGTARTNPGIGNPDIERVFGKVDEEFTSLFFFDENDIPFGAILNFADHTDSTLCKWGWNLSADYPGVLSMELKKELGNDFVPVFFLGCSGNLNILDVNRGSDVFERAGSLDVGEQLAKAALLHMKEGKELKVDEIGSIKEYVEISKKYISEEETKEAYHLIKTVSIEGMGVDISKPDSIEYKRHNAETVVAFDKLPSKVPVCVQTLKIGECMIFALLGEPFCEYGLEIKKKSPAKVNIVVSLANGGMTGYIPTREAFGTQIYEAQLPAGWLAPEAGDKMVETALSQAERL